MNARIVPLRKPSLYRRSRMVLVESIESTAEWALGLVASQVDKPVLVFGNQKSGTTAIAALLSRATGLSVALDFCGAREPHLGRLLRGEVSIDRFVAVNRYPFSKAIVKEPNLTLVADKLMDYFGLIKAVFIVRDPRTNIQSQLNRLAIPGDLDELSWDDISLPNKTWHAILAGEDLNSQYTHYVDVLAHRWVTMASVYFRQPHRYVLLRYEDFIQDKIGSICTLAHSIDCEVVADIAPHIDIQYQPAASHRTTAPRFFGEDNLFRIDRICRRYMDLLQYE